MATAKSYANYPILEGPYEKNGKEYVIVKTKTNPHKEVRWYTGAEYAKMYGLSYDYRFDPHKAFGFDKGYIHVFTSDGGETNEFFRNSVARYSTFFGWYIRSVDKVPTELPDGVRAIKIMWEDISKDGKMLPNDQVAAVIAYFKGE